MMEKLKSFRKQQVFWPLMILLIILAINGLTTGGEFFAIQVQEDGKLYGRIIDILRNGSPLMLLAMGVTMCLSTGGTDISVGAVMAISGAVASILVERGTPFGMALIVSLLAGMICGLWNGFLVAKIKVQPMVATMILLTAGRGIAQLITSGRIVAITDPTYYSMNSGHIFGIPLPVYIVVLFFLLLTLFLKKTSFGLYAESVGINPSSSRFTGINPVVILLVIYTISGLLAAMAGIIDSAAIKGADANNAGLMIEMDAILAVAIGGSSLSGGKFSMIASIIGAIIIQTITTSLLAFSVPAETIRVFKAIIVIGICLFQSPIFQSYVVKLLGRERAKV